MRKYLLLAVASIIFLLSLPGFGQTSYYVDAYYGGSGRTGSPSRPWQSLNDSGANGAITTSLASGPVTVYYNAKCSGANVVNAAVLAIPKRTDSTANLLTFDGISQYNSADSSCAAGGNTASPNWQTNVTPVACIPDPTATSQTGALASCAWYHAAKSQIGTSTSTSGFTDAIQGYTSENPGPSNPPCDGYIKVQGFRVYSTQGKDVMLGYIHDLTIQYIEASGVQNSGYTEGPQVYVGPENSGPCSATSGPDNVTVQYNYFHNGYEDCIYDGAPTPDPPGYPSSEYTDLGLTCTTACPTGANHVIQYNVLGPCATITGSPENVGINIKAGHANATIRGNIIRECYGVTCTSSATGPSLNLESCGTVDGNYIENSTVEPIGLKLGWNDSVGRAACLVTNNFCINQTQSLGTNDCIIAENPNAGANQLWQQMLVYNNSSYLTSGNGINIESGSMPSGTAVVENNIISNASGTGVVIASGLGSHDYNDCYSSGTCSETNGITSNPDFVSTSPPYAAANFKLSSSGQQALTGGTNLTSTFTDDFFGTTRPSSGTWSVGAFQYESASLIAWVSGASTGTGGTAETSLTITYSPTAGNTVVVGVDFAGSIAALTCKDNNGNALALVSSENDTYLFEGTAISGAASYKLSWTGSRKAAAVLGEYSGVAGVGPDATSTGSTTPATISVTSTQPNSFVVAVFGANDVTYIASTGNLREEINNGSSANSSAALVDNTAAGSGSNITDAAGGTGTKTWWGVAVELYP